MFSVVCNLVISCHCELITPKHYAGLPSSIGTCPIAYIIHNLSFSVGSVGFIGMLVTQCYPNIPDVSYFFLFLVAAALYSPINCVVYLVNNNLARSSESAVSAAL